MNSEYKSKSITPPVRAAVLGAGNWGSKIVRVLNCCDSVDLRYVVDLDADARKRAGGIAPGVRTTRDMAPVLDDVDAFAVCTLARDHVDSVAYLLRHKKDVFVEKPFAMSRGDALSLATGAKKAGSVLMVGHQLIYHPVFSKLLALVKGGHLGKIQSIRAVRSGSVDLEREPGVLWAYGPHDVAMILALMGEEPQSVTATGRMSKEHAGLPLAATMDLEFRSGVNASICLNGLEKRKRRITAVGAKHTAVFDDNLPGGRLFVLDSKNPVAEERVVRPREPLQVEVEHFARCVQDRTTPLTGAEHATKVTTVLETAQSSLMRDISPKNDRFPPLNGTA